MTNEEYLQDCFQNGIVTSADISSKLSEDVASLEKEIALEFEELKAKKLRLNQLSKLLQQFAPNQKKKISKEDEIEKISPEGQELIDKIIIFIIENANLQIRPSVLANCLLVDLSDIYWALKHLLALRILIRDEEQNILRGPEWENRYNVLASTKYV